MDKHTLYIPSFNSDTSEQVPYNEPSFPAFVQYRCLSAYPNYSAVSHWHRDLEFIVVKKGHMTYNVNGHLIELAPETGIMVNSRQLHHGFSETQTECEFLCVLLSPDLLEGNQWFSQTFISRIIDDPSRPYVFLNQTGWKASILKSLESLHLSFQETPLNPSAYFETLIQFSSILKVLHENPDVTSVKNSKEASEISALRNMITYIEGHYTERISLNDIAIAGACCKSKCSLLFKKHLRETPNAYVTQLRLRRSLSLLADSDKSIAETACECGFCTASYFCEVFKKYYGTSPLLYKKCVPNH